MSGLICAQKQLPLSSLHHTNGWKNSASRYGIFIYYISYIIWSQKWSGAAVTQWHRFALQEAVSWDRTVTGGGKRQPQLLWHSKPQTVCDSSRQSWPGQGHLECPHWAPAPVPARGSLAHTLPVHVQPQISLKFTDLGSLVSSPGCEDKALNVLNILEPERKVSPLITCITYSYITSPSGDVGVVTDAGCSVHINA